MDVFIDGQKRDDSNKCTNLHFLFKLGAFHRTSHCQRTILIFTLCSKCITSYVVPCGMLLFRVQRAIMANECKT